MGVLQFPQRIPATIGNLPSLRFMVSTDNLATLTTAGYLNSTNTESATPLSNGDVVLALYGYSTQTNSGTFGIFIVSISSVTGITLSQWTGTQQTTVTMNATQVQGAYATPVLIVPSPGTGLAIMPIACQIITLVSTAFAGGGVAQLQWGNTVHGGGTVALDATTPAAEITAASSQIYTQYGVPTTTVTAIATANGLGLYFSNATGAFTGGAGSTVTIAVTYMVIPV